jgi:hypothetical protein
VFVIGYGTRSVPTTLGLWLLRVHAGNMMTQLIISAGVTRFSWFTRAAVC